MKVLVYFESQDKIKTSGIGRALRHQMEALTHAGVEFTLDKNDTYDIAHLNTYFFKSKKVLKKCKKKGIPVIMHGHSTIEDFRDSFRIWKLVANLWYNRNLRYFYKKADHILTPTPYSKRCIDAYNLGTPVDVVSNGINVDEYAYDEAKIEKFKKHFDIKDGEKVVIGVGFYFIRKGLDDFMEVARHYPNVKFIWFGYLKPIMQSMKIRKVIKNKPDNVIMPGYIDNDIIKGAYRYAECLFFPSREETEGIVVLEALASSCPVLVRDIGVYSDWLEDGRDCYKAEDKDGFIEKLDFIMNNKHDEVIKNGLELAESKTLASIGEELKEAYTKVYDKFKGNY